MSQNLIEKIVQNYCVNLPDNQLVKSGDYLTISPAYIMTHDNTGAVIPKFNSMGFDKLFDSKQVVFTLDHDIQNKSEQNLNKYQKIKDFSIKMGNDFYPAGRGIGHQVMIEEGYIWPGSLVVASDSHSNTYGGLGVLGTPVVRTDAASIWATGKTWWQIPPVVKVSLNNQPNSSVSGKDIILSLCSQLKSEAQNTIVEFSGNGLQYISIEERLTIANMTTEWGALGGVFPVDENLLNWFENLIRNNSNERLNNERLRNLKENYQKLSADENAEYQAEFDIDLSKIGVTVTGPHNPKTLADLSDPIKIDKAYLLSCTNGRIEDFKSAAEIVSNKKINPAVEFYISAASAKIEKEAKELGYWQTLTNSGAISLPSGCGPCIGLGEGLLEDNEVGISATNRNFQGRMGSKNSNAYLASPATVAYSAIKGYIYHPDLMEQKNIVLSRNKNNSETAINKVDVINGFPEFLSGRLIFCNADNINTDLIYPGKYTYRDDFSSEDQSKVVMENYDSKFASIVKTGDILLGGYNFGGGSSREQAATALKYSGIKLIIAGSFSQTYTRNAINNGILCIQQSELLEDLRTILDSKNKTELFEENLKVDFINSNIKFSNKYYNFLPIGKTAQEIIIAGGLEYKIKADKK